MIGEKIQQNVPLAPMSTFKIGGSAEFFVEVGTKEELLEAIEWARAHNKRYLMLGGGSNILINDKGVASLVIKLVNNGIELKDDKIICGAGAVLAKVMILANGNRLSGLEWAVSIPGTVGGAVRGNAGAFGSHISHQIEKVTAYNAIRGQFEEMSKEDCKFDYRESAFKGDKNLIIWSIELKLVKKEIEEIKNKIDVYITHRQKTQPKLPSAGSVFKNIRIEKLREANDSLASMAEGLGKVNHGFVGAGWLVELIGYKGRAIGGAKVSLEHGNFIVNTGKATSDDVVTLISLIKQQTRTQFGVQLQEEIQYFGM